MVREKRWRPLRRWLASLPSLMLSGAFMAPDLGAQIPVVNPVVSFGDQTVIASGMTPKGQVVWFGVMRDVDAGTLDWSHDEEITADQGGMGTVQLDIGKSVAVESIWFAVDLATGRFAVNAPAGYALRQFELTGDAIPAARDHLAVRRSLLIVVLIRPGVGAWTLRAGDGAAGDSDEAADGKVDIDLTQLVPIGSSPGAPKNFSPKDTLLVVDQAQMDFIGVALD
jgi:hypothetical protein